MDWTWKYIIQRQINRILSNIIRRIQWKWNKIDWNVKRGRKLISIRKWEDLSSIMSSKIFYPWLSQLDRRYAFSCHSFQFLVAQQHHQLLLIKFYTKIVRANLPWEKKIKIVKTNIVRSINLDSKWKKFQSSYREYPLIIRPATTRLNLYHSLAWAVQGAPNNITSWIIPSQLSRSDISLNQQYGRISSFRIE